MSGMDFERSDSYDNITEVVEEELTGEIDEMVSHQGGQIGNDMSTVDEQKQQPQDKSEQTAGTAQNGSEKGKMEEPGLFSKELRDFAWEGLTVGRKPGTSQKVGRARIQEMFYARNKEIREARKRSRGVRNLERRQLGYPEPETLFVTYKEGEILGSKNKTAETGGTHAWTLLGKREVSKQRGRTRSTKNRDSGRKADVSPADNDQVETKPTASSSAPTSNVVHKVNTRRAAAAEAAEMRIAVTNSEKDHTAAGHGGSGLVLEGASWAQKAAKGNTAPTNPGAGQTELMDDDELQIVGQFDVDEKEQLRRAIEESKKDIPETQLAGPQALKIKTAAGRQQEMKGYVLHSPDRDLETAIAESMRDVTVSGSLKVEDEKKGGVIWLDSTQYDRVGDDGWEKTPDELMKQEDDGTIAPAVAHSAAQSSPPLNTGEIERGGEHEGGRRKKDDGLFVEYVNEDFETLTGRQIAGHEKEEGDWQSQKGRSKWNNKEAVGQETIRMRNGPTIYNTKGDSKKLKQDREVWNSSGIVDAEENFGIFDFVDGSKPSVPLPESSRQGGHSGSADSRKPKVGGAAGKRKRAGAKSAR